MKSYMKTQHSYAGSIMGLSGEYDGAIFKLSLGETLVIGRDPKTSQIVLDEECTLVSRTHCSVIGDVASDNYCVTDFSQNGTFVGANRLPKGVSVLLPKGTVICVGDNTNKFRLN